MTLPPSPTIPIGLTGTVRIWEAEACGDGRIREYHSSGNLDVLEI